MVKRAFISICLIAICNSIITHANQANIPVFYKWVVQKGGTLKVDGSTNINKFSCKINDYSNPDTILIFKGDQGKEIQLPMGGKLALDIKSFNCGNAVMTADLRKTLKAKEFPYLTIQFLSLSKLPEAGRVVNDINGWVEIGLAGVKKRFLVQYTFSSNNKNTFHLKGVQNVNFSDFNLTPPRKLGGMIRANERLDVEFQLDLAVIP